MKLLKITLMAGLLLWTRVLFVAVEDILNPSFISSLIEHFYIRHVILPTSSHKDILDNIKTLSGSRELFISVIPYRDLPKLVTKNTISNFNALVIINSDEEKLELIKVSNVMDISLFKWVLITGRFNPMEYAEMKVPYNCLFIIADGSKGNGYYLTEVYDTFTVSKVQQHLGEWSPETSLQMVDESFYTRRRDFHGTVLNLSSHHEVSTFCSQFGYHKRLFFILLGTCSISILSAWTTQTPTDLYMPSYIQRYPKNVRLVVLNRTGGFGPETLSKDIQYTLFETSYITDTSLSLGWPTFRVPLEVFTSYLGREFKWSTFIYPFSKQMWIAIFLWLIVSAAIIALAEYVIMNIDKKTEKILYFHLWLKYVFMSIFALSSQSENNDSSRTSMKMLIYMIFLIPTVLIPGYSAALTSFLAVKQERMPFTNLEGLSKSKDYTLGYQATFNFSSYIPVNSKDEVINTIIRDILAPKEELPKREIDGFNKMCEEKYSYINLLETARAITPHCTYFKLDKPIIIMFTSLPMKNNVSYNAVINSNLRRMLYSGIVLKEVLQLIPPSAYGQEENLNDTEMKPVEFENLIGIFVGLAFGMIISVLILLAEVLIFKSNSQK